MRLVDELRADCAQIASVARFVSIEQDAIESYAEQLLAIEPWAAPAETRIADPAAFWITLDAINFGSGWFPTLRKPDGRSGYHTIATALEDRFAAEGPWSAAELRMLTPGDVAGVLGQDPQHALMGLFAASLRDLGAHLANEFGGRFNALIDGADGSAVGLVERFAGWDCFADTSTYEGLTVRFLKRAQICAADLARAGVAEFGDLDRLTMFADNLVPHVLRLDGVLRFDPALVDRIERGELLTHGSPEEVEVRACALHAVELLVAALPGTCAAQLDEALWQRGQAPRYKAMLRHRCRATAY